MSQPTSLAEGRYLLVSPLGEGGMATVYRAFDQRLQVWRAVKILAPDFAKKKKIRKRFEAEAQTMALLEHRNIVRVYDVGRDGDVAYIVMELLVGGCLVDWVENHGPMPPRMAVDAIAETCDGLQAAHDKGVIHRDIKPHNVLVTAEGVCRVTDFGIARVGDLEKSQTKTGSVMGTWGYMAPEQRTNAKGVDARADVYATGATLYSLLTDKMPMDLFAAERDSSILDGVHELLIPVLVKSTEYDREDRFESVTALKKALLEIRDQLPEIPEGTPPLAVGEGTAPAPPDPTQYEKAPPHPRTQPTMLPDEMGGTPASPTLLPDDGVGTSVNPAPSGVAHQHAMTLPPEEVAVTQPGAITRQSRPVFDPSGMGPAAPANVEAPPEAVAPAPAPPQPAATGRSGTAQAALTGVATLVWGLGGLLLILVLFVVLYQLVLKDLGTEDTQTIGTTDPVQPAPEPEEPKPEPAPEPTEPKPAPTPAPPPPAPSPTPTPTPAPPTPAPTPAPPTPTPAPAVPAPEPAPAPAVKACFAGAPAKVTSNKKNIVFSVVGCESTTLTQTLADTVGFDVFVHYRVPGGTFKKVRMSRVLNKALIHRQTVTPEYAGGVEYYMNGWGGSYGSAASPKVVVP